jgi:hypothetical protein
MQNGFDFTTDEILDWELEMIHRALLEQRILIENHAADEARNDKIKLVEVLQAILVGTATLKDLPGNTLGRVPGVNFEHRLDDGRWIRVKVGWLSGYAVITTHTI